MIFVKEMERLMEMYESIKDTIGIPSLVFHSASYRSSMQQDLNGIKSQVIELLKNEADRQGKPLKDNDLPSQYRVVNQEAAQQVTTNRPPSA